MTTQVREVAVRGCLGIDVDQMAALLYRKREGGGDGQG
jgi:hypothetical protein